MSDASGKDGGVRASCCRRTGAMACFLLTCFVFSGPAAGFEELDIRGWLAQPRTRLVAVEFYATWCKPCMKAVPKWKALQKKYRKKGLRLIVVSVQSDSSCAAPDWIPDSVVCDYDGLLAKQWRAEELPQAFLWNWQGNMLVAHGSVEQVEAAVEEYFADSPRILVEFPVDLRGQKLSKSKGRDLKAQVRGELKRAAKFDIVATDSEKRSLRNLLKKSRSPVYDEASRCKLGAEVSPNSVLKITLAKTKQSHKLRLKLFSIEGGCLTAAATAPIEDGDTEMAAIEAVAALVRQMGGKPKVPGGGKAAGHDATTSGPAKPPSGSGPRFDELLSKSELEEAALETAWKRLRKFVSLPKFSIQERAEGVRRFLVEFGDKHKYAEEAAELFGLLSLGEEPGRHYVSPTRLREKTEWLAIRFAGGNRGIGGFASLFTIRWPHFYWEIARGYWGGANTVWALGGTAVGIPWHIDKWGRHEIRFGLALMAGVTVGPRRENPASDADDNADDHVWSVNSPLHLAPEIYYVWHARERFALEVGLDLTIGLGTTDEDYAPPMINGFIGFRI